MTIPYWTIIHSLRSARMLSSSCPKPPKFRLQRAMQRLQRKALSPHLQVMMTAASSRGQPEARPHTALVSIFLNDTVFRVVFQLLLIHSSFFLQLTMYRLQNRTSPRQPVSRRPQTKPKKQAPKRSCTTYTMDANFLAFSSEVKATELSSVPGVTDMWVNNCRNIVAVDASDIQPLLSIETMCGLRITGREALTNICGSHLWGR